jgi:hypothetical protein
MKNVKLLSLLGLVLLFFAMLSGCDDKNFIGNYRIKSDEEKREEKAIKEVQQRKEHLEKVAGELESLLKGAGWVHVKVSTDGSIELQENKNLDYSDQDKFFFNITGVSLSSLRDARGTAHSIEIECSQKPQVVVLYRDQYHEVISHVFEYFKDFVTRDIQHELNNDLNEYYTM